MAGATFDEVTEADKVHSANRTPELGEFLQPSPDAVDGGEDSFDGPSGAAVGVGLADLPVRQQRHQCPVTNVCAGALEWPAAHDRGAQGGDVGGVDGGGGGLDRCPVVLEPDRFTVTGGVPCPHLHRAGHDLGGGRVKAPVFNEGGPDGVGGFVRCLHGDRATGRRIVDGARLPASRVDLSWPCHLWWCHCGEFVGEAHRLHRQSPHR